MIILGIDPGYAILGWGVIEKTGNHFRAIDYGSLTTDKDMEMPDRLESLYDGLRDIIEEISEDLYNDCQMSEYSDYRDPVWESKYIYVNYDKKKRAQLRK